jgi:hypothetical protein
MVRKIGNMGRVFGSKGEKNRSVKREFSEQMVRKIGIYFVFSSDFSHLWNIKPHNGKKEKR